METFPQPSAEPCRNVVTIATESHFHTVALEYLDGLFGYAMTLTRNKSDAEDLVQETYLRAARASSRLNPDSHIRSWLHAILRNTFLNQVRHHRSGPAFVDMDDDSDGSAMTLADESAVDPLASYLTEETKRDLRQAVDSLPHALREVIVLREYQDLSYQEIAEVVQCPLGTVMSRLGRARDRLRQTFVSAQTAASEAAEREASDSKEAAQ